MSTTFETLRLRPEIVKALAELGITAPTLIQEKAIPIIKEGKDLIGISKTGSGKTAAFGIPLLEKIKPGEGLQGLVVAPTRELAVQISQEIQKFGKYLKIRVATVYGGVALDPQTDAISRADIVVGTPGRLVDHLERRNMDLSGITMVALDEADKMVEMGFIEDIQYLLNYMPKTRQILLFGATISSEIDRLKEAYMNNPETAEAEHHVQEDLLQQFYCNVQAQEKFSLLVHLLNKEQYHRAIVFCSSRSTVEILTKNLQKQKIDAEMIHGKLTQSRRLKVINEFNHGKISLLVASAVAARGLDIKDVTHIFNYDLSPDPQEYIHRVGRTARAGEMGKAITLLSQRDYGVFNDILRRYPIKVEELQPGEFPKIRFEVRTEYERGDSRGGRDFRGSRSDFRGERRGRDAPREQREWRSHDAPTERREERQVSSRDSWKSNGNASRPQSYGSRGSFGGR